MKFKFYTKLSEFENTKFIRNNEFAILIDFNKKWFSLKFPIFLKEEHFGSVIDQYTGAEYNDFYREVKIIRFSPIIKTQNGYKFIWFYSDTLNIPTKILDYWRKTNDVL